jgi:hypothetical protein
MGLLLWLGLTAISACNHKKNGNSAGTSTAPSLPSSPTVAPPATTPSHARDHKPKAKTRRLPPASSFTAAPKDKLPFSLEKNPQDIATGSYAALGSVGAVIRRKDDELLLIRLGSTIHPLDADGKTFAMGKTVAIDHEHGTALYWIKDNQLFTRYIDETGKISKQQRLAKDADNSFGLHGIRTQTGSPDSRQDLVAYVARPAAANGERRARIWIERKGTFPLSGDVSGASSVFVSMTSPQQVAALWLDERSALASVYVKSIELDGAGEPRFGEPTLAWFAPPSELHTTIVGLKVGRTLVSLLATQRDGLRFALASAPIKYGAPPVDEPRWLAYPNGLDPAPVIPASFCGQHAVALVRPVAAAPTSARKLELALVTEDSVLHPILEVAEAMRIDHVDAWVSEKGDGWVVWAGDGRTKVRKVRCPKSPSPRK